jgi:tetratricopeptide (TPR) repeat protein
MLKSIFSWLSPNTQKRPTTEAELLEYGEKAFNGLGVYATKALTDDWPQWAKKMQDDLFWIQWQAKKYSSSKLYSFAGMGWDLFSVWYRRKNEDKETPLRQAISMFEAALRIDPNHQDAKIGLGKILINRVQVRNIERALEVLEGVQNKTGYVQELINKAKRWKGEIKFDPDFDYTKFQLIPLGNLLEERKKCRALIRSLKKAGEINEMRPVLEHMYRIAILHDVVQYVFNKWYCTAEGREKERLDQLLSNIAKEVTQYSYQNNGGFVRGGFLSDNDYKYFELAFGKKDKVFDPTRLVN